jgi:hypothetical protein
VITLNHVIEHVFEPVDVLARCSALLRSGGQLWIETPNISSYGHARFQRNWRGLEAPRHLVLFNSKSLHDALCRAGFAAPRERSRPSACPGMFRASFAMERGKLASADVEMPLSLRLAGAMAALAEKLAPTHKEFLTISASRVVR